MLRTILIGASLAGLIALGVWLAILKDEREKVNVLRIGQATLAVDLADTPEKITLGLSGREEMDQDAGMLFLFERADRWPFWMKDMHFPLDLIWIDEEWKIVQITADVSPETFPQTIKPDVPVRYVLEVNAGWAARHNIAPEMEVELQ